MAIELADDATHADIQKYVDQITQEAEEDRKQPEEKDEAPKGDAQTLAEDRDEPVTETATETESGDEAADKDEETGDSEGQAWLDDDLKAEIAAYGIGEEELADFTSREEAERALRFFDRSALEAGRKALADGETQAKETGQPRNDQGRFTKADEDQEPEGHSPEGRYEVTLDKETYDEGLVAEFVRMRDHYESRLGALEDRLTEADARAEEQHFDGLVDSLGHADLFGKTGKENSKQLQRRQDLHVAVKAQHVGLQALGRGVDLNGALVARVARMVFADELGKKDLKARTRRISKQSNGRMGGGATKAHDSRESLMDEMEQLYKELEGAG